MIGSYGYFTDAEDNPLGPDDPIVVCALHRQDDAATILKEAHYIDADGHKWTIKPNQEFDGASIPRFFRRLWRPFQRRIRDISAFHDVYCKKKSESQWKTHQMYRTGAIALGVSKTTAWIHWAGIRMYCRCRYPLWK